MKALSEFNAISFYYDWLVHCVFGNSMTKAQSHFLNKIKNGSSILVLGGGSGLWLPEILQRLPELKICFIDASERMLDLARRNSKSDSRIDFIHGTENSIPGDYFDTIVTFCYLDLFSHELLDQIITKIKDHARPNAQWLVVDFVNTSWWHATMLRIMYFFFRLTAGISNQRLPHWEKHMLDAGMVEQDIRLFYGRFIRSSVYLFR